MAIFNKNNPPTGAPYVTSAQGLIGFEVNGQEILVRGERLATPFLSSFSGGNHAVERLEGNSFIISGELPAGTAPSTAVAIHENYQPSVVGSDDDIFFWTGDGKIEVQVQTDNESTPGLKTVEVNIVDLPLPIGVANKDRYSVEGGAFMFASDENANPAFVTGTTAYGDGITLNESDVIHGGKGKAVLTSGTGATAFEKVVNLDTFQYPFTLAAGEELKPIGSAFVFAVVA